MMAKTRPRAARRAHTRPRRPRTPPDAPGSHQTPPDATKRDTMSTSTATRRQAGRSGRAALAAWLLCWPLLLAAGSGRRPEPAARPRAAGLDAIAAQMRALQNQNQHHNHNHNQPAPATEPPAAAASTSPGPASLAGGEPEARQQQCAPHQPDLAKTLAEIKQIVREYRD